MPPPKFTDRWLEQHLMEPVFVPRDGIVGIGHVLTEIDSLIARLDDPGLTHSLGLDLPRGILLWGDPGLGKTLAARYLASRLGAAVPFYEISSDELSPDRLRGAVRYLADHHDRSILYLDEIDQWAMDRSHYEIHSPATRLLLIAALSAFDGLRPTAGPIIVASSNRSPESLDAALTRAGRLGVHISFDYPDEAQRVALLELFIAGRPTVGTIDLERAARVTRGRTPADLRAIIDDAYGLAIADARRAVHEADLEAAVRRAGGIIPNDPLTDPELRRRMAVHEAGHVAVGVALRSSAWIYGVSLGPAGGKTHLGNEDEMSSWRSEAEHRDLITASFGGVAAERLILEDGPSFGGDTDLATATRLATSLFDAGLATTIAPVALDMLGARTPEVLRRAEGREVALLLERAQVLAMLIVARSRDGILDFAARLAERTELTGDELRDAIAGAFPVSDDSHL
ncbi:MAG TPA: AAA family ATPase [Candidatus Limnocylindrales bacterium]